MIFPISRPESPRVVLSTAMLALLFTGPLLALASPESPGISGSPDIFPGSPPGQLAIPAPTQPPAKPTSPESTTRDSGGPVAAHEPAITSAQRDEAFKKVVTNIKLVGNFTVDGEDLENLRREEYVITGAMKVGDGDFWLLTAQIKYGDVDLTVPVPVQVKWAGDTPMIAVDSLSIPGLGTFSARVLLDKARYAGTWSHDEKGGNLFGVIERNGTEAK